MISEPNGPTKDTTEFRQKLSEVINQHSMESGSNTPDFILAQYLTDCLAAFDRAMVCRGFWYRAD